MVTGYHGHSQHSLYAMWKGMLQRCYNPEHKSYHRYGGRGITVYERWLDCPCAYIKYVQQNLPKKSFKYNSIDRIDNDKGYEPGNLRWTIIRKQNSNKNKVPAHNRKAVTVQGCSYASIYEAAEAKGVSRATIRNWIKKEALD